MSGDTIRNYIALTQLVPELQQMVDEKKIALSPAYQIAALMPKEQGLLLETIDSEQATPLALTGAADEKAQSERRAERGHHALDYDGAEEAGEKRHHPFR